MCQASVKSWLASRYFIHPEGNDIDKNKDVDSASLKETMELV